VNRRNHLIARPFETTRGAHADEDERKVLEKELKRWEETTFWEALGHERRKEFVTTSRTRELCTRPSKPRRENRRASALGWVLFPFTRRFIRTMYRGRLWTMRMFAGYGSAEDTNRRFKYLISHARRVSALPRHADPLRVRYDEPRRKASSGRAASRSPRPTI